MKTGLYFGSFNPVHIGHMAIANYIYEYSDLDEIWFVVSPHNPLKKKSSLLASHHRLRLAEIAIADDQRFRVSDIESKLPQPSYTIDTVSYLREKHPGRQFALIMGSDNLLTIHKWKNADILMEICKIYVYPRKSTSKDPSPKLKEIIQTADIEIVDAPNMEISGTFIRSAISEAKDIRHFLPPGVWQYIIDMNFYRQSK
ncbi:MAG: nicotinate (nicotinamide) nucleotide adenylyltransferase [Bacteroidales bacterium]|nr:nicotinate (nicotinamide) nucleotide adenylyltransferase [Bacteroidales bacterium]